MLARAGLHKVPRFSLKKEAGKTSWGARIGGFQTQLRERWREREQDDGQQMTVGEGQTERRRADILQDCGDEPLMF